MVKMLQILIISVFGAFSILKLNHPKLTKLMNNSSLYTVFTGTMFESYESFEELKANNIEPLVTLSHYEMPLSLMENHGGWSSRYTMNIGVAT